MPKHKNGELVPQSGVPAWSQMIREACFDAISVDDVCEGMKAIAKRAREGSREDMKFILDYLGGGKTQDVVQRHLVLHADVAKAESTPAAVNHRARNAAIAGIRRCKA